MKRRSHQPTPDDLLSAIEPWAREAKLSDAGLADLCRRLADQLMDTGDGSPAPARPTKGLAVTGHHGVTTRMAMWFRAVRIEDGVEVFSGQHPYGSYWVAELLGIVEAVRWADDSGYEHPIWCACPAAIWMWNNKQLMDYSPQSDAVRARLYEAFSCRWPEDIVRFWSRWSWGRTPADFGLTQASGIPVPKRKRRRSANRLDIRS